jgi:hypothetical protein
MIVRGIAIAVMLLGHSALAQPTVAMRKAIRTIHQDLERYDTLSPFGDAPPSARASWSACRPC